MTDLYTYLGAYKNSSFGHPRPIDLNWKAMPAVASAVEVVLVAVAVVAILAEQGSFTDGVKAYRNIKEYRIA